ncbi:hypothetical protein WJX73_006454 [Symbiochloris irregularis]|uniref:Beta-amylase n=1 Tax=Symbiochloris irregularis TaxID=706552 RepID=A0AAW1P864_9CHLO
MLLKDAGLSSQHSRSPGCTGAACLANCRSAAPTAHLCDRRRRCPSLQTEATLRSGSSGRDVSVSSAVAERQVTAPEWAVDPSFDVAELTVPDTFPPQDWPQTYHSDFEKDDVELNSILDRIDQDSPLLHTVWLIQRDGKQVSVIKREKALDVGLRTLRKAGVEGVMVDVWWGIVEEAGPTKYDFSAYRRLFQKVAEHGLKIQAVMSFHAAGGNVGDTCKIPLPPWVLHVGEGNPDIYYTDRSRRRNREYISLGCDTLPLFWGRSPVQIYQAFISAFLDTFSDMLGTVVTEITVGMGPAGELRYPSYPEGDGRWRFPGVGEFQCYDKYMLAELRKAADAAGQPEWGLEGPHDAGTYNSYTWETGFFRKHGGNWQSDYGRFFLDWYSGMLLQHAQRVLSAASLVASRPGRPRQLVSVKQHQTGDVEYSFEPACPLGIKLAGVHWWFKSRSHAAELTAGYYNTCDRNWYADVMGMLASHNARASFTCVEMRDCEHPPEARCSPQGLLEQVVNAAAAANVPLAGENALQRYDRYAFDRIAESAFGQNARAGHLQQLTFLRMGDLMFDNWDAFSQFLNRLRTPEELPPWALDHGHF